jgi:hypothetical protein
MFQDAFSIVGMLECEIGNAFSFFGVARSDTFPNVGMLARTARHWHRQIAKMDAFSNIGMLKHRSPKWMPEHRCWNAAHQNGC